MAVPSSSCGGRSAQRSYWEVFTTAASILLPLPSLKQGHQVATHMTGKGYLFYDSATSYWFLLQFCNVRTTADFAAGDT
jgi:hypothetical protein